MLLTLALLWLTAPPPNSVELMGRWDPQGTEHLLPVGSYLVINEGGVRIYGDGAVLAGTWVREEGAPIATLRVVLPKTHPILGDGFTLVMAGETLELRTNTSVIRLLPAP